MNIQKRGIQAVLYTGTAMIMMACMTGCNNAEGKLTSKTTENMEKAKGYTIDIEKATIENENFRKVLYTAKYMQLVLMTLKPNEEIGEEVHATNDQFFRFESGKGICTINDNSYKIKAGDVIIVPAGARHNVINSDSTQELKMYTIYSPPNHKDGIVRSSKAEAESNGIKYDGQTTE